MPGGSRGTVQTRVVWRPVQRAELVVAPEIGSVRTPYQYVAAAADGAQRTRWILGDLRQTTGTFDLRASWTFRPTLSLQLWGQPFASIGTFDALREVVRPTVRDFAAQFARIPDERLRAGADGRLTVLDADGAPTFGFADPAFGVRELRAMAVLRWEWRPGSTLHVAWNQTHDASGARGAFAPRDEAAALWRAPARDVLQVKLSVLARR